MKKEDKNKEINNPENRDDIRSKKDKEDEGVEKGR